MILLIKSSYETFTRIFLLHDLDPSACPPVGSESPLIRDANLAASLDITGLFVVPV